MGELKGIATLQHATYTQTAKQAHATIEQVDINNPSS